jgi:DNA replication and repair protein RecF
LGAWTAQLLGAAARVTARREAYVAAIGEQVRGLSERLLGEPLSVGYLRGWRNEQTLAEVLDRGLERDRRVGQTEGGPHRADLQLSFKRGQVKDEASRGQQKLIAAILILAQVQLFSSTAQDGGLLLVDDPAAELDSAAFARLRDELERLSVQIVMTGLDASRGPALPGARMFHVEQGRIDPVYTTVV